MGDGSLHVLHERLLCATTNSPVWKFFASLYYCISVSCHLCPAMLAIIARCASTAGVDTVLLWCGSSLLRPCYHPNGCAALGEAQMVSINSVNSALERHSTVDVDGTTRQNRW